MEIPVGLCQCGCGLSTNLAPKTVRSRGWIKGQPLRFLKGHAAGRYEIDRTVRAAKDLQQRRDYKARRKEQGKILALNYLASHACVDCGETDPDVLDFDHRNPGNKKASISQLIFKFHACDETLLAEIAKCDVRCANCHRRKHRQEWRAKSL